MKPDERELLKALQAGRETPLEAAGRIGMHRKRLEYILNKWSDRGWYNYGVSVTTGWLEGEGMTAQTKEDVT